MIGLDLKSVQGSASDLSDFGGWVFDIQRFSLHDGPGIRTIVFAKGCPLRCRWCSNPESQNLSPEVMNDPRRCSNCGKCELVCQVNAIIVGPEHRSIDFGKCNRCMKCTETCTSGAIKAVGRWMTVEEVMREIDKDVLFYQNSKGGVTLSGGEPVLQQKFSSRLLKACKEQGLHTALETCGFGPWHKFRELVQHTDLVLFDVKHMDSEEHRKATGKGNSRIIDNMRKAAKTRADIWMRIPLIPGFNDTEENIRKCAEFAMELRLKRICILPFHQWGQSKYNKLGRLECWPNYQPQSDEDVNKIVQFFKRYGFEVTIGR